MSLSLLAAIAANGSSPSVDLVRLSLEGTSAHWFRWVLIWGYLVAIGCAMEVPETVVIIKHWIARRFKHEDPAEDSSWRIPLSAVGLLLIIAGVAGETICESLVSTVETNLRTHESQILSDAESKASDAVQKAAALGKETEGLKTDAANAKRDMVAAQLELARLTGPIQSIPVINGVASPDPTKGLRFRVLLHTDVRVKLPTLSTKGKAITWTLMLTQDDKGGHQFKTFPHNVMFGNDLASVPHSFCTMEFVTDEYGTTDITFGAASCPSNQTDTRR